MEDSVRQHYRTHKKMLDLLKKQTPLSGFELAVRRLLGDDPKPGKIVRIGNHELRYSSVATNLVSFLPVRWHEELEKVRGTWSGCENWWAGYPFIAWVELRSGAHSLSSTLKLNAEIGPVSEHKVRKGIIKAIELAASVNGLERIQFPHNASDKGRLYSRFLRNNSIALNDVRDTDEVEGKIAALIADFQPEFEVVASVMPQFLKLKNMPL